MEERKNKLTVIMPFLNEKEEVDRTLQSIRQTSDDVAIILIDDASTDGYDYKTTAQTYGAVYIRHRERKGVAASRDEGVAACTTDYFLLLDAHMRFYRNDWADILTRRLDDDDRVLLCCQTKALFVDADGQVACLPDRKTSYGAHVNLYDSLYLFEPAWCVKRKAVVRPGCMEIPCVLGAGYAASKRYWTYLKGLSGLKQYGNDEPYISMKVWMEGGRCLLVNRVTIGHIYRTTPPYPLDFAFRVYNRLLLAHLLLPEGMRRVACSALRHAYKQEYYNRAWRMLLAEENEIDRLKACYDRMLTKKDAFFAVNKSSGFIKKIRHSKNLLKTLAYRVLLEYQQVGRLGLLKGKMGLLIFLYHYAGYMPDKTVSEIAAFLLDDLCGRIDGNTPANFCSGLWGIGWGLEYLSQKGYIRENLDELLQEVDRKVLEIDVGAVQDPDLDFGFGGVVLYVLARLKRHPFQSRGRVFGEAFLEAVLQRAESLIRCDDCGCDCLGVYVDFRRYMAGKETISDLSVFDVVFLSHEREKYEEAYIEAAPLDLKDGLAGLGLNLIYELSDRKFRI